MFDVEPIAAPEPIEPVAVAATDEPELVAPTLDLDFETAEAEAEADEAEAERGKWRRKRRSAKRVERAEEPADEPVSLFTSPPPEPEPFIDLTVAEPEVVVPVLDEAPAASIAEPDIDLTAMPAAEAPTDTRHRARGWRVRRNDKADAPLAASAAREAVVPEVVVPEVVVPEVVAPEVVVPEVVRWFRRLWPQRLSFRRS